MTDLLMSRSNNLGASIINTNCFILLSLRSPLSLLWLPDGLTRLVVPSRSLGAVRHGQGRAGLAVLTHHPVVRPLHLLLQLSRIRKSQTSPRGEKIEFSYLAVVRVEEQARFDRSLSSSSLVRGLVLLSGSGVVSKPVLQCADNHRHKLNIYRRLSSLSEILSGLK